ncbi:MAG TPA: ProQ/FINO family protein [Ramlibacter sp.]|uniref:ProQ/FINO family protein n=1 Tax=Ramlibacter sp. TaxID=1917967 RepID=UPI002C9A66AA|nr:ProQ/FINO family protein [Ramlibacter sp.]HVZ46989.1 ProQ/FINO family protein [Ramlibacter sp.]
MTDDSLPQQAPKKDRNKAQRPRRALHPLLRQLAHWHPQVFGPRPMPLKVGTFEELVARHPELAPSDLKAALAQHARSTPYLESVAAGEQRHDLDGRPVEPIAPEHRHHAIMEVFRRRQARLGTDLGPWLLERLICAIDASGLDKEAYLQQVRTGDPGAQRALADAFALRAERAAKREAVRRAYEGSGRSVTEFAQMYGLDVAAVQEAIGLPAD